MSLLWMEYEAEFEHLVEASFARESQNIFAPSVRRPEGLFTEIPDIILITYIQPMFWGIKRL